MRPMRSIRRTGIAVALSGLLVAGCASGSRADGTSSPTRPELPLRPRRWSASARRTRRGSAGSIEPLAKAADRPPKQVTIGILADQSINAANAGGGEFYVTRGLLDRATDEQLRAIMAHEFAHNDLGHVAKAQRLQAGVELGAAILEQVVPNAAIITPIAGTLITRAHSRSEELEADKHAVTLLRRVGSSKESLQNTLAWLASTSGGGGWGRLVRDASRHQRPHPGPPAAAVTAG